MCSLLLQLSHVCVSGSLCVGYNSQLCKKAEPIKMTFGMLTRVGPMEPSISWVLDLCCITATCYCIVCNYEVCCPISIPLVPCFNIVNV